MYVLQYAILVSTSFFEQSIFEHLTLDMGHKNIYIVIIQPPIVVSSILCMGDGRGLREYSI
jgi:hypothetical protein